MDATAVHEAGGLPLVRIHGIPFAAITEREAAAHVAREAAAGRGGWVVTPNLDIVRQVAHDPAIASMVRGAELFVADGMPLVWASRIQRTPLPERVAGSNLVGLISQHAAQRGLSVFLLGGNEGMAERAAGVLQQRYPGLRVAGTWYPPFGFDKDPAQMAAMHEAIRASRPDVVFVGLGFPKQERVIVRLREAQPQAWWLGVGITFSFLAGEVSRAPMWMQRTGLEWVHRVAQEPGRLARRYLVDDIPFAFTLLGGALRARRQSPG